MSEPGDHAATSDAASSDAASSKDADVVRADIERTRAQLADTVDALSDKLDVKAQAGHKADEAKTRITDAARQAKQSAPAPVQHAIEVTGDKAGPVVHKIAEQTRPHAGKIAGGAAGLLVVLLVVRRIRSRNRP